MGIDYSVREIRNSMIDEKYVSLRNFYYSTLIAVAPVVGTIAQLINGDLNESVSSLNFLISLPFFAISLHELRTPERLSEDGIR